MRKERRDINLASIQLNTGQLDWLPANPRTWTQSDIDDTRDSILEDPDFLEDRPILVVPFGKEFVAFGGNLRREGADAAKMSKVPCVVYLDPQTEEDYETILRRAMKDNGQFGKTDWNAVYSSKWGTLPLEKWGLTPKGWTSPEGEGVNGGGGEPVQPIEAHEDDFSEEDDAIKVRCKPGDIWQLGEHRLMCGDSIDLEQVKTLMGVAKADLLLTDPPYNVEYVGAKNRMLDHLESRKLKHGEIENDVMDSGKYGDFLRKCLEAVAPNLKAGGVFYVWYASTFHTIVEKAILSAGLLVKQQLIWNKNALVLGWYDYKFKHEPCMYGWKGGAAHYFTDRHDLTTVIDCPRPTKSEYHPTMKPVQLFAGLIENSTRKEEIVLDVFGGSGTTLIAAEQLNRKAYLMEIDPHYCDVILARWEKLTGRKAEKVKQ